MKKNRKKNKRKTFMIVSIVVSILFIATGYSLLNGVLNISGSVHTKELITGTQLNIGLISSGTRYTGGTIPSNITFQNETLNANELTVNFVRANSGNSTYISNLTINFTNNNIVNMVSGASSVQIISGSNFSATSTTLSKTTLIPNEQGSLTVNFTNRNKSSEVMRLRVTMQYTSMSVTQYFYYNININLA